MAYTKIHQIKKTLGKALAYILDPNKTEGLLLAYGYECEPLSAAVAFEMTEAIARSARGDYSAVGGSDVLAHHMIQSFSPKDKLTAQEAHAIGQEWAGLMLKGRFEYVLSTHVDKGHIHNHIIFNATSFADYKKFETEPYKTAAALRKESDRICEAHGLSTIASKGKGKSHYEWSQEKAGLSWKAKIKAIIDDAIPQSKTFEGFVESLQAKGVEVANASAGSGKHIAYKLEGQTRSTRGKTIGEGYTREGVASRIAGEWKGQEPAAIEAPVRERYNKFASIEYWRGRNARLEETKELFEALYTIKSEGIAGYEGFEEKASELAAQEEAAKSKAKAASAEAMGHAVNAMLLISYKENAEAYQKYESLKKSKQAKYRAANLEALQKYELARDTLGARKISPSESPEKFTALANDKEKEASDLSAEAFGLKGRIERIEKARETVEKILPGPGQAEAREAEISEKEAINAKKTAIGREHSL